MASTIIPVISELSSQDRPLTSSTSEWGALELPDELMIPLPPSRPLSGSGLRAESMPTDGYVAIVDPFGRPEEDGTHREAEPEFTPVVANKDDTVGHLQEDQYIEPLFRPDPSSTITSNKTYSLEELGQLVREDIHGRYRSSSLYCQTYNFMVGCGIRSRNTQLQRRIYRSMADQFQTGNLASFDSFLKSSREIQATCNIAMQATEICGQIPKEESLGQTPYHRSKSWIHTLPEAKRQNVINLLTKIRTDPNFLAGRISCLSSGELLNLTISHQSLGDTNSIIQSDAQTHGKFYNKPSIRSVAIPVDQDQLPGLYEPEPLFLLLHAVFDNKALPGSEEYFRRIDIWSTVCAQVFTDGKRGSDEFAITVLDAFANFSTWPLKQQLEVYLMKLAERGSFLLEPQPAQAVDFTQPAELQNAKMAVAVSEFFDDALETLFGLILDGPSGNGIPDGVLDFVHAILSKIQDPKKRFKARNFIVSRWYCTSFLSHSITYPESHGLMGTQYVSGGVRQKIFRELVVRLQKQVIDVMSPWRNVTHVVPGIEAAVNRLIQLFESDIVQSRSRKAPSIKSGKGLPCSYLTLSTQDLEKIVKALFPRQFNLEARNGSTLDSLYSSASSITGSSTLTSGEIERRFGTTYSTTPSVSGSSVTSHTTSGDGPFGVSPRNKYGIRAQGLIYEHFTKEQMTDEEDYTGLLEEISSPSVCGGAHRESPFADFPASATHRWSLFYLKSGGQTISLAPFQATTALSTNNFEAQGSLEAALDTFTDLEPDQKLLFEALIRALNENGTFFGVVSNPRSSVDNLGLADPVSLLESSFHSIMVACRSRYDFSSAHFWWKSIRVLKSLSTKSCSSFIDILAIKLATRIQANTKLSEKYEPWLFDLQVCQKIQEDTLKSLGDMRNGLRDKMWYSSEVKHSSTYEDALNVTRALRAMANPAPSKQSGVTAWARQRLRTFSMHDRAQAQTLDALAAPQDHGGPAKLSDAQVDLTSRWLTRSSIENFCKGEERVHRFCFEVRKCVNNLVGESLLESPVLWSSCLYQHEKEEFVASSRRSGARSARDENLHGLSTSVFVGLPTSPTLPSARFKISESSRSPNNASPQWNEFSQPWRGPPPTSDDLPGLHWPRSPMGPSPQVHVGMPTLHLPFAGNSTAFDGSNERISSKSLFIGHLKQSVTSLLLSDLGYIGWNYGSETDRWVIDDRTQPPANMPRDIFTVLGQRDVLANAEPPAESTNTVVDSRDCIGRRSSIGHVNQNDSNPKANAEVELPDLDSPFPYVEVYKRILEKFALSSNPQSKLKALYELTLLATNAYEESMNPSMNQDQTVSNTNKISNQRQASWTRNIGVPRTRATRLEEVMANCEERRANTMLHNQSNQRSSYRRSYPFNTPILDNALSADALGNNHVVPILQSIFRDGSLRPKTLFRDLQYIAAFVPSSVLDNTPEGKAFWDTGLAALSLKADICKSMITHANDIVLHHLNNSNAAKKPNSSIATDRESSDPSQSSLAEAARLYLIAAQEGDPTAARELALFYLTHPELVPRATLALSRPSEVFKVRSSSLGSDRGSEGKQREGILDPLTFAVAFHWMEFAANGGDKDAKAFFKENGELGRG